ncbi:MAG: hypothetical protein IIB45_07830 [Candidatus Marinimicrobia bacterium]|nr:hypothetical protein [Candidatus Neomarinimicrobiota bacterium]
MKKSRLRPKTHLIGHLILLVKELTIMTRRTHHIISNPFGIWNDKKSDTVDDGK